MSVIEIRALNPSEVQEEKLIIHEIFVRTGQLVDEGDLLMIIEGAKVIFDLEAPSHGSVIEVFVLPGQEVEVGKLLITLSSP